MQYCTRCLYPSTKPGIRFDSEGVCSACRWYERKKESNFYSKNKKLDFLQLIKANKKNNNYDCIIPVSGGKDSTYQVWKVLQLGLNPLCVTAPTDLLSEIGRRNLNNCKSLGVDHLEFSVNQEIRRKINKYALETVGDIQWPEHVLIFTIPVHVAVMLNIPLIIWGENSVREYGAGRNDDEQFGVEFTRTYLEENCGFNGLRVTDLVDCLDISETNLNFYQYPDPLKVERVGVKGVFLDDYFEWNGMTNQFISQSVGLEVSPYNIQGTLSNSENLDNYYHGIHDYLKYLKFGFGRATDMANNWIRRGLISREDAAILIKDIDGSFPDRYLDKSLGEILATIDLSIEDFKQICDDFTNYSIFKCDENGELILKNNRPVLTAEVNI